MNQTTIQELRQLALDAQTYQLEREWSDAKICKEIAQLGSTKTFKRILNADDALDELNVDAQLKNYRAASEMIKVLRAKDRAPEPEYDDFTNITESMSAVASAIAEESISRFVCIEGENGTGKDAVKNALLKRWPNIIVSVEANEAWRTNDNIMLSDIISALDVRRRKDDESGQKFVMPKGRGERLELVFEELQKRKLILLINEMHHMSPSGLNYVKALINRTPVVPVGMCIPKLLARLVGSSYQEAVQLFGNRLCQRVRLPNPPAGEILLMCDRRGVRFMDDSTASAAAKLIATEAPQMGNWAMVKMVVRECRKVANEKPLSLAQFSNAFANAKAKRVSQQTRNN